jgi:hypothetical protein
MARARFVCPVCELPVLDAPVDLGPVCPACGTAFEIDDEFKSYQQLRTDWLSRGAQWYSVFQSPPPNWRAIRAELLLRAAPPRMESSSAAMGFGADWRLLFDVNVLVA